MDSTVDATQSVLGGTEGLKGDCKAWTSVGYGEVDTG